MTFVLVLVAWIAAPGCGSFGTVEQGRAVAYDPETDAVTLVLDASTERGVTAYTGPVRTFTLPHASNDRGPDPSPGGLLEVRVEPGSAEPAAIVVFDGTAPRGVALGDVEVADHVDARDPRVWDRESRRPLPLSRVVGDELTVWLPNRRLLVTGRLPAADAALPASTFRYGDEVRLYVVEPPVAARFMNITRTDIFAK